MKNRDLFTVRLGSHYFWAVSNHGTVCRSCLFFLRGFVGLLIEDGTFLIDIALDAYREGQSSKNLKEAKAAYDKATAKIYDEVEKQKIREEYLRIISKLVLLATLSLELGCASKPSPTPAFALKFHFGRGRRRLRLDRFSKTELINAEAWAATPFYANDRRKVLD